MSVREIKTEKWFVRLLTLAAVCSFGMTANAQEWGQSTKEHLLKLQRDGGIGIFRQGTPFFRIGFGKNETRWDASKTKNYLNRLKIKFGEKKNGVTCLLVTGAEKDTAWQISTKKIPYKGPAATPFTITLKACASKPLPVLDNGGYSTNVIWYDAKNNMLAINPFQYKIKGDQFAEYRTCGMIPEGAASFAIELGFDVPDVQKDNYAAFSEIVMGYEKPETPFVKNAWLETAARKLENNNVSWNAVCPAGTAVKVQVAEAGDDKGKPGVWSVFHGPDGTANTFYTKPFRITKTWAKLKIFFVNNGNKAPVLKSVTFDGKTFTKWDSYEPKYAPLIESLTVSPTKNRRQDIVLRISSIDSIDWSTLKVRLNGENVTKRVIRKGNLLTIKANKDYTDGLHKVVVNITDSFGRVGKGVKYLMIGENPKNVPHVTLRNDGVTLIDGKPFFPVGIYAVQKREFNNHNFEKAFHDLHKGGFNFVQTYHYGDYKTFLDTAHKYGMKVWSSAYNFKAKEFRKIRLNHPAIIAWYTGDDTAQHTTPNKLQDRYDSLKAIDDHRIITQADAVCANEPISHYVGYVRGADNFLPEIYPVAGDNKRDRGSCVSKVIRDMIRIKDDIARCGVAHPPSIWPIIQYFKGWGWERFPEVNELRAMSYASIIHGGNGITWYTYGGAYNPKTKKTNYGVTSTPERWKAITTLATQLRDLGPVFTEPTPADQPVPRVVAGPRTDLFGYPSVTCLMKRHKGETYIIAVNSVLKNVEVSIPVRGIKGGNVMFENRKIKADNGAIKDTFKPYDVHVYRLK